MTAPFLSQEPRIASTSVKKQYMALEKFDVKRRLGHVLPLLSKLALVDTLLAVGD